MDMILFAKRLKESRNDKNVSAKELAEHLGINKSTIHRYESGELKGVKTITITAIAEYLNVNPDYLIGASDIKHTAKEAEALMADITDDEKMLLEMFRQIPEEQQQVFLDMGRVYANSLKKD